MNEILFEVLKVVIMVAVLLITRYVIPWVKGCIGADKLEEQLDILIEAAVKQMKIEENSGITINNSAGETPGEKAAE